MDVENSFIKPILLFYYGKGMSEAEAYEEVSKKYGPRAISLKTIRKWYTIFKPKDSSVNKGVNPKQKFTDEFLIDLVNKNPDLNMAEIAKMANCSCSVISRRIKNINKHVERVSYKKKFLQNNGRCPFQALQPKFSDEFLINLVSENPGLSMTGLAKIADCSKSTIYKRLSQINSGDNTVFYINKNLQVGVPKFTDEFLINLINQNPGLSIGGIAKLADCARSTISARIKLINSERADDKKIVLQKVPPKISRKFTDEFLIDLVNENPDLSMSQLANLANVSRITIFRRLKQINSEGERVKYINKNDKENRKKFTDEYLISLVNDNPDLDMDALANLANVSRITISRRLKEVNNECERVKYIDKSNQCSRDKFTDDFLIELIKSNPDYSVQKLAKLAGCRCSAIYNRVKLINNERADNNKIVLKNDASDTANKLTDEFFINLINDNPGLSMKELGSLVGINRHIISKRLNRINYENEKVKYVNKNTRLFQIKFTDEYLVDLINNNPGLNMEKLAELSGTSVRTISRRLKEINEDRESSNKISLKKGISKPTED
jgi:transcriptional antiterminator